MRVINILLAINLYILSIADALGQSAGPSSVWLNFDNGAQSTSSGELVSPNLFTGNSNITVPFYEYVKDGVNLGVSISYNTEGVLVDMLASNIGLGWELHSGGSIQRIQRGKPDDVSIGNNGYWSQSSDDKEADIFVARFGGRSITFLFSKDGQLLTIPKSNVRVERYWNGSIISGSMPSNANGDATTFVIVDESGNRFYFKKGLLYQYNFSSNNTFPIDKWVIDKFIPYDGGEKYQVKYYYTYPTTHLWTLFHEKETLIEYNTNQILSFDKQPDEKTYEYARLDKIEYPNNIDVKFEYDGAVTRADYRSEYRMATIRVVERVAPGSTTPQEYSYSFNQGYFVSPSWSTPISTSFNNQAPLNTSWTYDHTRYRLKLDGINLNSNGSSRLYYGFEYNSMPLPERVYGAKDKYGYATNQIPQYNTLVSTPFYTTVPLHSWPNNTSNYYGINRSVPNVDYTKACILQKITNARGGKVTLSYTSASSTIEGGLLLNSVSYYDGYNHDNDVVNSFEYSNPIVWEALNSTYSYEKQNSSNCVDYHYYRTWYNSYVLLSRELNGPNKGFRTVLNKILDKNNNVIKATKYYFSGFTSDAAINNGNDDNWLSSGNVFGLVPFSNKQFIRSWGVGLPTTIEYFDHVNNLIKRQNFKYTVTTIPMNSGSFDFEKKIPSHISCYGTVNGYYTDQYHPFTGYTQLIEKEEQNYTNNTDYIGSTFTYSYDGNNNLISSSFVNSRGQTETSRLFYNYNWSSTASAMIDQYNTDGLMVPIYSVLTKNGKTLGLSISGMNSFSNMYRPKYSYVLAATTLPSYTGILLGYQMNSLSVGSATTDLRKIATYTKYDDMGLLLEKDDNGNYTSFIWDSKNGNQIAEAYNARHEEIAYCGFESNYQNGIFDYNKGNWDFNPSAISTQFSFLGRSSYHCSSTNQTTLWTTTDLVIGKKYCVSFWVQGSGSIDVNDGINVVTKTPVISYNNWTLFKAEFTAQAFVIGMWGEGYVDELRLYPEDALMKNSNYLPLVGKTSEVNANDIITYFEYDAFRNLEITRDHRGNIIYKSKHILQGAD